MVGWTIHILLGLSSIDPRWKLPKNGWDKTFLPFFFYSSWWPFSPFNLGLLLLEPVSSVRKTKTISKSESCAVAIRVFRRGNLFVLSYISSFSHAFRHPVVKRLVHAYSMWLSERSKGSPFQLGLTKGWASITVVITWGCNPVSDLVWWNSKIKQHLETRKSNFIFLFFLHRNWRLDIHCLRFLSVSAFSCKTGE